MEGILKKENITPFLEDSSYQNNLFVFDSLESTNKYCKELPKDVANKTIVLANSQTAGKGRFDRNFYSPIGTGIYISFILKLDTQNPVLLTTYAAVEVCKLIEKFSKEKAEIKWVNDIYVKNKKVCGILTEANINFKDKKTERIILGIGLNLTTKNFPEDIENKADSIFATEIDLELKSKIVAGLINQILKINILEKNDKLYEEYKSRNFVLGKEIIVNSYAGNYKAIAKDIDKDFRLIVEKEDKQIEILFSGEISIKPFA